MCRATIASLVLQEKLSILEKALGIGVLASEGPASSEAATLVLTLFTVLRDMVSWAVKGQPLWHLDQKHVIPDSMGCDSDVMPRLHSWVSCGQAACVSLPFLS